MYVSKFTRKHHTYVLPSIERSYDVTKDIMPTITTTNCKIIHHNVKFIPGS